MLLPEINLIIKQLANANKCNNPLEVKYQIQENYPEYIGKFTDEEINEELLNMKALVQDGERLYPDITVYGKHKYHVTNNGYVHHEDSINEWVDESDDFTWTNKVYEVDIDLLPKELRGADDETIGDEILNYHYGILDKKPEWIL